MTGALKAYDWRRRRCLVTGAAGFIAGPLCRRLRALGAYTCGLSRREPAADTVDCWLPCDVTDLGQVRAAMDGQHPAVVFHLASRVSGSRSIDLVLPTLRDNLNGFVHVAVAGAQLGCERIICMGSLQEPDRDIPAIPCSPYAASKFAASCYARMLAGVFAVPITIARPLMVYGPGQMDFTKLVPYVLSQLLQGREAQLSSGAAQFDWVHVDDVADALVAIAAAPDLTGRTLDIGTGVLVTAREVAQRLALRVGLPDALKLGVISDRQGEPIRFADVAETERLTGWRARIGLEAGLDQTVDWYKAHVAQPRAATSA